MAPLRAQTTAFCKCYVQQDKRINFPISTDYMVVYFKYSFLVVLTCSLHRSIYFDSYDIHDATQ